MKDGATRIRVKISTNQGTQYFVAVRTKAVETIRTNRSIPRKL